MMIDILLSDEDRERLGAPDALVLDMDRVRDTPLRLLMRWERECGYAIEAALDEILTPTPTAVGVAVCVWLARKQMGVDGGGTTDDGQPEPFGALDGLRTLRVGTRRHRGEAPAGDALPPDGSPAS